MKTCTDKPAIRFRFVNEQSTRREITYKCQALH